jgi:hypothetical protein
MAISTVLGRFIIPIYLVLGERIIEAFGGVRDITPTPGVEPAAEKNHGVEEP